MINNTNELSALSYVNKDFNTLFPEILDLAKTLSYKWDPTISNESDPGVVLLKLVALMADKLNFNIDTNILELFPASVTQLPNARQLYDQLGCPMRYYRSAKTDVAFTIATNVENNFTETDASELNISLEELKSSKRTYIIPRFTMVADAENNYVFTTTEDCTLTSEGITVEVPAIQGVANRYSINGDTTITSAHLNYENRLYFKELDIAENGIFITSINSSNYWERVDNIVLQPLGTQCFKFGINDSGTQCYIEFPSDIDTLIGEGINITYIRTAGFDGNISIKFLSQLYSETKISRYINPSHSQTITVPEGLLIINNYWPATGGLNPETIEEVHARYQKVKTTFDTLVSLPDYTNYMITNKNVSNGYVCDRNNDIQSAYQILSWNQNTDVQNIYTTFLQKDKKIVGKDSEGKEVEVTISEDEMSAFNLRIYATKYVPIVSNSIQFNQSFIAIDDEVDIISDMYNLLHNTVTGWSSLKTIQHDFLKYEADRPLMFKNKYPITARIIPQFKITTLQQSEIVSKIRVALYQKLNAKELSFGDSIDYTLVYDTILNADPRIKALILNDITYETYAVYKAYKWDADNNTFIVDDQGNPVFDGIKELRIDSESSRPEDPHQEVLYDKFRTDIYVKSVLAGKTQFLTSDFPAKLSLGQTATSVNDKIYYISTNTEIKTEPPNSKSRLATESSEIGELGTIIPSGYGTYENDNVFEDENLDIKCHITASHCKNGDSSSPITGSMTFTLQNYGEAFKSGFINTTSFTVPISEESLHKTPVIWLEMGNYSSKYSSIKYGESVNSGSEVLRIESYEEVDEEGNTTITGGNEYTRSLLESLKNSRFKEPYEFVLQRKTKLVSTIEGESVEEECLTLRGSIAGSESTFIVTPKLKENENLVLTSTNLIDDIPYTGYTKFIYKLNMRSSESGLSSNYDYTLGPDEYIMFFWKAEEEGPYKYRRYKGSSDPSLIPPTISTSFFLTKEQPKVDIKTAEGTYKSYAIPHDYFLNLDNFPLDEGEISETGLEIEFEPGVRRSALDFITNILIGSDYVLSGTNKITTKKPHKIEITPHTDPSTKKQVGTTLGFWILNHSQRDLKGNEIYRLFEDADSNSEKTPEGKFTQSYTLKSGEYFIYTNESRNQLYLLGSGTKLTRIGSTLPAWDCQVITYDELIEDPINNLNTLWEYIGNVQLFATEQQFYQISNNYSLKLTPKDGDTGASVTIDREGTSIYTGTYDENGNQVIIHHFNNYEVAFLDQDSIATVLPIRNYPEYAWYAESILNLSMSPTKYQKLSENQTITLYGEDKSTALKTFTIGENDAEIHLLSDVVLDTIGGEYIDVRMLNIESGVLNPISIYSHEIANNSFLDEEEDKSEWGKIWNINISTSKVTCALEVPLSPDSEAISHNLSEVDASGFLLPTSLPAGDYVIPVSISSKLAELHFYFTNDKSLSYNDEGVEKLVSLTNSQVDNFNETGKYLLHIHLSPDTPEADITNGYIGVAYTTYSTPAEGSDTSPVLIGFETPYKYRYEPVVDPTVHENFSFENILPEIVKLDKNNNDKPIFNYLYQVALEDEIPNPLEAASFVNDNHIFNQFTICQWNENHALSKLVIENRIK